jgi:hypothetical protein
MGPPSSAKAIANPTVSTSPAYSSGDVVGGIWTFQQASAVGSRAPFDVQNSGTLVGITLKDASNQKPTGNLLIFKALPTGTYTDNGAFSWGAGDFDKLIDYVPVASTDWTTVAASKAVARISCTVPVFNADSPNVAKLYMIFVTNGAPQFTATTDLEAHANILQD